MGHNPHPPPDRDLAVIPDLRTRTPAGFETLAAEIAEELDAAERIGQVSLPPNGMTPKERALRALGFAAAFWTVASPPLWMLGLGAFPVVCAVVAWVCFAVGYLAWWFNSEGGGTGRYVAAYLGAGFDTNGLRSPIYSCRPYLVYGPKFRRRARRRRIRELEIACGLEPSAFSEEPSVFL